MYSFLIFSLSQVCDGVKDCPDGEDEARALCSVTPCLRDHIRCETDHVCLPPGAASLCSGQQGSTIGLFSYTALTESTVLPAMGVTICEQHSDLNIGGDNIKIKKSCWHSLDIKLCVSYEGNKTFEKFDLTFFLSIIKKILVAKLIDDSINRNSILYPNNKL